MHAFVPQKTARVFIKALCIINPNQKQPKCLSSTEWIIVLDYKIDYFTVIKTALYSSGDGARRQLNEGRGRLKSVYCTMSSIVKFED